MVPIPDVSLARSPTPRKRGESPPWMPDLSHVSTILACGSRSRVFPTGYFFLSRRGTMSRRAFGGVIRMSPPTFEAGKGLKIICGGKSRSRGRFGAARCAKKLHRPRYDPTAPGTQGLPPYPTRQQRPQLAHTDTRSPGLAHSDRNSAFSGPRRGGLFTFADRQLGPSGVRDLRQSLDLAKRYVSPTLADGHACSIGLVWCGPPCAPAEFQRNSAPGASPSTGGVVWHRARQTAPNQSCPAQPWHQKNSSGVIR
ncbi:MAG: hypothetical protein CM15mP115_08910 [Alphaproteobacteria bacterium]|nr:MAG: hypothetical protein CM15mP115_08910 [Alphaproteobacteria bacterium]